MNNKAKLEDTFAAKPDKHHKNSFILIPPKS